VSLRIIQLSDPHLSATRPFHQDNWEQVLEALAADPPDLIIVTGDVVLSDPDEEDDHGFARRQLDRLPGPWRVLPGNHDIGDNLVSGAMAKRVDAQRLRRWHRHFGEDRWSLTLDGWLLLGINAQILNAPGLAAEAEQAAWLEAVLAKADPTAPVALFLHKPLFMDHPSETAMDQSSLDLEARNGVMAMLAGRDLRLVASGHKHQWRAFDLDGVRHVWAPSTASVNGAPTARNWGLREVGFVEHQLEGRRTRQRLLGRDWLTRHESYVVSLEHGSPMRVPILSASAAGVEPAGGQSGKR
jgi:3',5'-cyclic AMP phosphodiesterase CpdA